MNLLFGYELRKRLNRAGVTTVNDIPIASAAAAASIPPHPGGQPTNKEVEIKSFVPKESEDGSTVVSAGGYFGQYIDIDGTTVASDQDLILKYRNSAEQPECDMAINAIVDEAIVSGDDSSPVSLCMNDLEQADDVKEAIQTEFDEILRLLDFNRMASDIFRRWYVDGRIYYHIIIDTKNQKDGIQELRYIDPIKMRKVREVDTTVDRKTGVKLVTTRREYFVYNENQMAGQLITTINVGDSITGLMIDPTSVAYVPSGLLDSTHKRIISYMHKSLKVCNQLRMMEDSLVIYRMARAPERRIFYIDVGNLPKGKAEEYMQGIMSKYRNKMVYDANSGAIRDDRRHMSMLEDFWLPRREGGKGTEITTLPGGDNLGQIDDINYFKKNLYQSLNVPLSRLDKEKSTFQLGDTSNISREEVAFQKFIDRLRKKFSYLFLDLLKTQLLVKGLVTEEDWNEIKEHITVDFQKDNYFAELKEFEILEKRMEIFDRVKAEVGTYFSKAWLRRSILKQTDDDIKKMDEEIAQESAVGILPNRTVGQTSAGQLPSGEQSTSPENPETPVENENAEESSSAPEESSGEEEDITTSEEETPTEEEATLVDVAKDDDSEDAELLTEIEEDGEMVPTLGRHGLLDLCGKLGLSTEMVTKEHGTYVRVSNAEKGISCLFDPIITTEKYLKSNMKVA